MKQPLSNTLASRHQSSQTLRVAAQRYRPIRPVVPTQDSRQPAPTVVKVPWWALPMALEAALRSVTQ